jgi:membrane protease YdiL (CAAX protease family)
MWKLVLVAVPIVLFISSALLLPLLLQMLPSGLTGKSIIALGGIMLSVCLSYAISVLCTKANAPLPNLGKPSDLAVGLAIGLTVSFAAGFAYQIPAAVEPAWPNLTRGIFSPMLLHVYPAATEEVTFRYGLVHAVGSIAGLNSSLIAGSIPFGLLHLAPRLFGNAVSIQQALGASLGGLLLSIVYVRYGGLLACAGCHWIWNVLSQQWPKVYSQDLHAGVQAFEGAWTTIILLALASGLLVSFQIVRP